MADRDRRHGRASSRRCDLAAMMVASAGSPTPRGSTPRQPFAPLDGSLGESTGARGPRLALGPAMARPDHGRALPGGPRARSSGPRQPLAAGSLRRRRTRSWRSSARVAPNHLQRAAPRLVQLLHATAACRCRSPARSWPSGRTRASTSGTPARSAAFVEEEVVRWLCDLVGFGDDRGGCSPPAASWRTSWR